MYFVVSCTSSWNVTKNLQKPVYVSVYNCSDLSNITSIKL